MKQFLLSLLYLAGIAGYAQTCGVPTTVTATMASTSTANLSWGLPATGIPTGYQYAVTASASPPTSGTTITATSVTNYVLTTTGTFYLHVRAVCSGSNGSWVTSAPFGSVAPGDTCATSLDLSTLTSPYTSTTVGAADNFYYPECDGETGAPDQVYYITVPNNMTLTISQTNNYDSLHRTAYGGSCPGATLIACVDIEEEDAIVWTNTTGTGRRVYWMQDGYNGGGAYTLTWSLTNACATVAPTASAQTLPAGSTVAALTATGTALQWYSIATGGTVLASTTVLLTGTYYVSQTLNACEGERTAVSVTISTETPLPFSEACNVPADIAVSNLAPNSATLTWSRPDGAPSYGYQVVLRTDNTPPSDNDPAQYVAPGTSYTNTSLTYSTTYYYWIRTICDYGTSNWLSGSFVTPAFTGCTTALYNQYPQATFTPSCTGTEETIATIVYAGEYAKVNLTANRSYTFLSSVATDYITITNEAGTTILAAGIGPLVWNTTTGGVFRYYFHTDISCGASNISRTKYIRCNDNVCDVPTGVGAADITSNSVHIFWTAALTSRTAEYQLYTSTSPIAPIDSDPRLVSYNTSYDSSSAYGNWHTTLTNITAATTYYFWVRSLCTGLNSSWVSGGSFTTPAAMACNGASFGLFPSETFIPSCTGNNETITTNSFAGEFSNITASSNRQYTFTSSIATDYITVTNADNTIIFTSGNSGTSGIIWNSGSYTGTIHYYLHTDNACGENRVSRSKYILCTTTCNTPAPTVADQTFCNSATVANLTATGTAIKWYTAATGGTALATTAALSTRTYFVSQTLNNCESTRNAIIVTVNTTAAPTATAQTFCNGATVAELTAEETNVQWYSEMTGGIALTPAEVLATGTYYVSQTLNNCESTRTAVSVTINTTPAPQGETTQVITADIADNATIEDILVNADGILWYASEAAALEGETPLPIETQLIDGAIYYATQTVNGCTSHSILAVTVAVTLGVKEVAKDTFKYFPNPVVNDLTIESSTLISNVAIYDLHGKLVLEVKWNSNTGKLNMHLLQSASYIVRVTNSNTIKNLVIVKK